MSEPRRFDCVETGHPCTEGGCTRLYCVTRERQHVEFLRREVEKARELIEKGLPVSYVAQRVAVSESRLESLARDYRLRLEDQRAKAKRRKERRVEKMRESYKNIKIQF